MTDAFDQSIAMLMLPLGLVLPLSSRKFVPAFVAVAYVRWAPLWAYGTQFEAVSEVAMHNVPLLFANDVVFYALGALSLVDVFGSKSRDFDAMMDYADLLLKPTVAAGTTYGVLSAGLLTSLPPVGNAIAVPASGIAAGLVFIGTLLRSEFYAYLDELDLDELHAVLSWLEEFWVVAAVVLLFVFPAFVLVTTGVLLLSLRLIGWILERRALAARDPCPNCQSPRWRHAPRCGSCGFENPAPHSIGFFGLPGSGPTTLSRADHERRLLSKGRCHSCGDRLQSRTVTQACRTCGAEVFTTYEAMDHYAAGTSGSVESTTLIVSGLFGLLPVIGAIPAMLYYRLRLVSPYRRYVPRWQSVAIRWFARVATVVLVIAQSMPGVGLLSLPALAWMNHRLYRGAFLRAGRKQAVEFLQRRSLQGWEAKEERARRFEALRAWFVPAMATACVAIGLGSFFLVPVASAEASCVTDSRRLIGEWEERFSIAAFLEHPLLAERFDEDGVYRLNEAAGSYRTDRSVLFLQQAERTHRYLYWVGDRWLVYGTEDGSLSLYERITEPATDRPSCAALSARAVGTWRSRDGTTLRVEEGGQLIYGPYPGRWDESGAARVGNVEGTLLVNKKPQVVLILDERVAFRGFPVAREAAAPESPDGAPEP